MKRYVVVAFLAALALCASAGAVEFGLDLGTRAVGLWPGDLYDFPRTVRAGVFDLLANVPLSSVSSVNFKVGSFTSTNSGKTDEGTRYVASLSGIDARVAFFLTAPIVKNAVSVYAGVGATYCYSRYLSANGQYVNMKVNESGVTVGVPAGLKLRLSRRVSFCVEMEVPDYGLYHDAVDDGSGHKSTLTWWQYGSLEPGISAAIYLTH